MKRTVLLIFLLFQILCIYAQDEQKAKIIIYRPKNFQGFAVPFKVLVNDTLSIRIRNNSYYEYECKPGEYNFSFIKFKKSRLNLKVENNKNYYIRIGLTVGFWTSSPELLLVDSISAYPVLNSGKIDKLNSKNELLLRPKNRIGANVISGSGFEGFPVFTFSDGSKSSINFGSGIGFNFLIGRELSRWIDVSAEIKYQESTLIPSVTNAEITFERFVFGITPAVIMPIHGGDFTRLKFGIGLDYVWSSFLTINTIKYPNGLNDTWLYKEAYGMHAGLIYECNFTKYFSVQYGIRWSSISYEFSKGNNSFPIDDKLINPDGSGLDFLFGINIHF